MPEANAESDEAEVAPLHAWKHLGIIATILWVGLWLAVGLVNIDCWELGCIFSAELSTIGSYFAGVFAPPAFAWLIFGYLLQSEELSLQREELRLQRLETARLADEAKRQATAMEQQAHQQMMDTFIQFAEMATNELNDATEAIIRVANYKGEWSDTRDVNLDPVWASVRAGDKYAMYRRALEELEENNGRKRDLLNEIASNWPNSVRSHLVHYVDVYGAVLEMAAKMDETGTMHRQFERNRSGILYHELVKIIGADKATKIRQFHGTIDDYKEEFLT